jgi:hypothetical protein
MQAPQLPTIGEFLDGAAEARRKARNTQLSPTLWPVSTKQVLAHERSCAPSAPNNGQSAVSGGCCKAAQALSQQGARTLCAHATAPGPAVAAEQHCTAQAQMQHCSATLTRTAHTDANPEPQPRCQQPDTDVGAALRATSTVPAAMLDDTARCAQLDADAGAGLRAAFVVPTATIDKTARCIDVVTRECRDANCFTKAYGRYAKGAGSVLATRNLHELAAFGDWGHREAVRLRPSTA